MTALDDKACRSRNSQRVRAYVRGPTSAAPMGQPDRRVVATRRQQQPRDAPICDRGDEAEAIGAMAQTPTRARSPGNTTPTPEPTASCSRSHQIRRRPPAPGPLEARAVPGVDTQLAARLCCNWNASENQIGCRPTSRGFP